jgi:hypothetical protein
MPCRLDRGRARRALVCVAALVAIAAASPLASPARPSRIAIQTVKLRPQGLLVTWRAAASGAYVVWLGTYCGGGTKAAEGRYTAPTTRTVFIGHRVRPLAPIRVCLRTSSGTLSDAVVAPFAGRPGARISIDRVVRQGGEWTMVWHSLAGGPYTAWVGGTYCGAGAKAGEGTYSSPAVTVTPLASVRSGAVVRVCLRSPAGLLSDAVRAAGRNEVEEPLGAPGAQDRSAFLSAAAVALAAFVGAWVLPFVWKRRRARLG